MPRPCGRKHVPAEKAAVLEAGRPQTATAAPGQNGDPATRERLVPAEELTASPWWERARRQDRPVPAWVQANLHFYDRGTNQARIGHYALETLIILTSASIPAAAAVGASVAVTGVLGAVVAALIGLRQLAGWREQWVRFAVVRSALEREVVSWTAALGGYAEPDADERLLLVAQDLVAGETGRWAMLRSREPGTPSVGRAPDA
jgi:Protein of unknown function (DUF4231)